MKPPFKLPVSVQDGNYLIDATNELICRMESVTDKEAAFIVAAINSFEHPVALCIDAAAGSYECLEETPNDTLLYSIK